MDMACHMFTRLSPLLKEKPVSYWKLSNWIANLPIATTYGWRRRYWFSGIRPSVHLPTLCPHSYKEGFCLAWHNLSVSDLVVTPAARCLLAFLWSLRLLAGFPSSVWEQKKVEARREMDRQITAWFNSRFCSCSSSSLIFLPGIYGCPSHKTHPLLMFLGSCWFSQACFFSSQWFPCNMLPYGSVYSLDLFKASTSIALPLFVPC